MFSRVVIIVFRLANHAIPKDFQCTDAGYTLKCAKFYCMS